MAQTDSTCEICRKVFKDPKHLDVHVTEQHSRTLTKIECPKCDYLSPRMTNIRKHFYEHHGNIKNAIKILKNYERKPVMKIVKNQSKLHVFLLNNNFFDSFPKSFIYLIHFPEYKGGLFPDGDVPDIMPDEQVPDTMPDEEVVCCYSRCFE